MGKKISWNRCVPPGLNGEKTWRWIKWCLIAAAVLSAVCMVNFLIDLAEYYIELKQVGPQRAASAIRLFPEYLRGYWLGFRVVALAMLPLAIHHYLYHWIGARPIYLMARLPDRWELHRRCLTLPLVGLGACAVLVSALVLLYYLLYCLLTPGQVYVPGQLWLLLGEWFSL